MTEKKFRSLQEFYPYYLTEHRHLITRILHFTGTGLAILFLIAAMLFHNFFFLLATPIVGYGFAWIGHLFFEKNKPATFRYPWFSLASDFMLFFDLFSGKEAFKVK